MDIGERSDGGAVAIRTPDQRLRVFVSSTLAELAESVGANHDTKLSTQTVTFSLVAYAQLALAERDGRQAAIALGAADGLRQRAGLRTWPSIRRDEAEL